MKSYSRMKKRLAKKKMGHSWYKINEFLKHNIKIGDIVHTCRAYNERITDIAVECFRTKHGSYIYDFDITTDGKMNCSWRHCITYPAPSKDEILAYWKDYAKNSNNEWDFGSQHNKLIELIKEGIDPFDDNGCIKGEFKV